MILENDFIVYMKYVWTISKCLKSLYMDYTPYKESECALQENDRLKFVYDFSVYNYIKN